MEPQAKKFKIVSVFALKTSIPPVRRFDRTGCPVLRQLEEG